MLLAICPVFILYIEKVSARKEVDYLKISNLYK